MSQTQQRLNKEHRESKAKPDSSIQNVGVKHAGPDVAEHARQNDKEVAEKAGRKLHKGEPVENPTIHLPGG